jgi:antitoxin ParD1/3/4
METMNIAVPPSLKEFVQTRVANNDYSSVSEYVCELIRADQKHFAKALLEDSTTTR